MVIKIKTIQNLFEKTFVIFTLFFATSPLILFLGRGDPGQGNPVSQAVWLCIYAVTFALVLPRVNRFVYILTRDKLLLLGMGLALLSVLWSSAPGITMRRGVALAATTAFGAYLAMRFDFREQLYLAAWALGIAAVLSLIVVFVMPDYGIAQSGDRAGTWRGIYHQKAGLGHYMALGAIVFFLIARTSRRYRWVKWGVFILSVSLLLLSTSKTAAITFVMAFASLFFYKILWRRWHYILTVPFIIIVTLLVISVVAIVISQLEYLTGLLGKSATMSGRTILWIDLLDVIGERPVLGYGYSAFWLGWDGPSAKIWQNRPWLPRYAHNGFFDLTLDLGLVGLAIFLLNYLIIFFKAIKWLRRYKTLDNLWPATFWICMLVTNLTDSEILAQNSFMWMFYIAISLTISVRYKKDSAPGTTRINISAQKESHIGNVAQPSHGHLSESSA